uniref:C-type lectin domain-containing protein n=2 Tax=Anabas testudineus TaxID=64144 RepID=A0A7N6FBE1_ANATE
MNINIMDAIDIYANVEETSGGHSKWKREMNRPKYIYENKDACCAVEQNRVGPALSGVARNKTVKTSSYKVAALILGLLCLLLFVGLITRGFFYTKDRSEWEMEMVQLQTSLAEEQDQFQKILENRINEQNNPQVLYSEVWRHFNGSFYYFSSLMKSWQESRNDCLQRGADLVIINSAKEQDFIRSWRKRMWIGLNDREVEGTWRWVDGTPVLNATRYWGEFEPNYAKGTEDCAEIYNYESQNSWNDAPCEIQKHWICELRLK